MKITLTILISAFFTLSAHADGFICEGRNSGLNLKVFNHTEATAGTRTPAVMILSNPYQNSNQTIAVFSDENRTLDYLGRGHYQARVDLRFNDSGRAGENIAGTKLGQLKTIHLQVKFNYSHASAELANSVNEIPGELNYIKRNGEILTENAICKRYHKN
jgi:hypothetical protein